MQSMNSYTMEQQSTGAPTRRRAAPEVYLFGGLTILLSFAAYLLPLPRTMLPFLLVLLPTLLALLFTARRTGRAGMAALMGQIGRGELDVRWLAVAILMALGLRLTMSVVALGMGLIDTIQVRSATPFETLSFAVMLFFAALFEEVGWRGYALPRLLATRRALSAALIIGVMWGLAHLALLLPGMTHTGTSSLAMLIYLVSLSVLLTWLYVNSGGSVLLVTIFHASQSFFVIINEGITQAQQMWLMAGVSLVMALIVIVISGPRLVATTDRLARWRMRG